MSSLVGVRVALSDYRQTEKDLGEMIVRGSGDKKQMEEMRVRLGRLLGDLFGRLDEVLKQDDRDSNRVLK